MKLTLVKPNSCINEDRNSPLTEVQRQFQMRNLKKMIRFMKSELKRLEKEGIID